MAERRVLPPSYLIGGLVALVTLPLVALWATTFGIWWMLGFAVWFLGAQLFAPFWVFQDAKRADRGRAVQWAVGVAGAALLGLALYVLARPRLSGLVPALDPGLGFGFGAVVAAVLGVAVLLAPPAVAVGGYLLVRRRGARVVHGGSSRP